MHNLILRKKTRQIRLGNKLIGGDAPILVQSMCSSDTRDVETMVREIYALETAGCEAVRVAVPDAEAADKLAIIKSQIHIPLIADIHFDYRLALKAIEQGVDGLRLNPGNIGAKSRVEEVAKACKDKGIPIRIGVNGGSLEKRLLEKYNGEVTPEALVESALDHCQILEDLNFYDIKVSLKANDVPTNIRSYELFSTKRDYPLHLGVTEAGTPWAGTIKSSVGIGYLLANGIGDTVRVSLTTDNTAEEVAVAYEILKSLNLRDKGTKLISCPGCGRLEIDLYKLVNEVETELKDIEAPIKVAVMGCVVNGPGEARDADVGIAGGYGLGLVFKKGQIVKKVKEDELKAALMAEIKQMNEEYKAKK